MVQMKRDHTPAQGLGVGAQAQRVEAKVARQAAVQILWRLVPWEPQLALRLARLRRGRRRYHPQSLRHIATLSAVQEYSLLLPSSCSLQNTAATELCSGALPAPLLANFQLRRSPAVRPRAQFYIYMRINAFYHMLED